MAHLGILTLHSWRLGDRSLSYHPGGGSEYLNTCGLEPSFHRLEALGRAATEDDRPYFNTRDRSIYARTACTGPLVLSYVGRQSLLAMMLRQGTVEEDRYSGLRTCVEL